VIFYEPEIKAKTHAEVGSEYGNDTKALYYQIKKAGLEIPRTLISPYHLTIIFNTFGTPERWERY
jgi:hypothetical protein